MKQKGKCKFSVVFRFFEGLSICQCCLMDSKICTIPLCPLKTAIWIGVVPFLLGALGLSVKGAKNFTISSCPLYVAIKIGVVANSPGALGSSVKWPKFLQFLQTLSLLQRRLEYFPYS